MKGDTVLDNAAFQLYPGQTRCEVVLSGGGETEKLNPILLEALIAHLPAAKEFATEAEHVFKLELRDDENEAPWFTKGNMERFIRFVSTPEVLERPNVLHAEMVQLETARKLPATLYSQVDGGHLSGTGLATERSTPGAAIKSRTETMIADGSRNELLRALDVRIMTLHQELDKAFSRATAAEFLVENIVDLLAFSERFHASRLKDACTKFLISCQQRQQHFPLQKNPDACFSGLEIPLDNKPCAEPSSKHSRTQDDKPDERSVKESPASHSHTDQQDEQESRFSSNMDNFDAIPLESCTTETEVGLSVQESNNMGSIGFEPLTSDNRSPASTRRPSVRSASPARARRSASPMRKVQIGRSGSRRSNASAIQFINYMPQWSNRERDSNRESESSDTDNESDGDDEKLERPPKIVSTRTISVQDAINLFERKQREQRYSTEGLKKNINGENRRLSAETGNSTTHEKATLRRWSEASEIGKLNVPNSAKHLLVIGKDKHHVDITPQSELEKMEERKDVDLRFSSTPKITESQIMQAEQVQGIISQNSVVTGSSEIKFSANKNVHIQGSGTTDNFSYLIRPENEPMAKQVRSSHELNQLLQEKANQLEACFAAHKVRSHAAEEGSYVPPSSKLHTEDEASTEFKSSSMNSTEPRSLDKLYAGSSGEKSHRKSMFPGTDIELDQQLKTMQSFGRASVCGSWSNSAEFDMQTLMQMVDGNCLNYEQLGALDNNKFSDELRGKFYDQYREKREAKLREEHTAKRSEKEAKLKAMQEVLERRKAEMTGKGAKSSGKRDPLQSQALDKKLQSSKIKPSKNKKELHKNNEVNKESTNDVHERLSHQKSPINRGAPGEIPSQTLTPRLTTDLPKSNAFRKVSAKSMASPTVHNSSPLRSSSPRSAIPKLSSTSNTSTGRRKSQSQVGGNPLARSMPNLADLKESSKTLSGRPKSKSTLEKGTAKPRGNNKGSSQNKSGTEPPHLDVNGSSCGSQSSHCKEEKKNRSHPTKGLVNGKEVKTLSTISSEESALTSKPSFYSKVTKKNSVVPLESKPFLRKGNGIGPGVGRGISKMKASSLDDAPKTIEDECQVTEEKIKETVLESGNFQPSNTMEEVAEENKADQQGNDAFLETDDALGDSDTLEKYVHSVPDLSKIEDVPYDCVYENNMSDDDRHILTVSEVSNIRISPSKLKSSSSATKEEEHEKNISTSEITLNEYDIKPSLEAEFLAEPPPSAALAQLTPSGLNSELVNPISSKPRKPHSLSQMLAADTDEEKTRKKWGSAQKPILDSQYSQKDAPKGLKRLLKFGRKNRSEMGTTDSFSVSTFAEGDESTEELKELFRRNANNLQRGQVQAKAIRPGNASYERSYDFQSTNSSVHSIQTSVHQDEHLTGSTLPKAPRSFFSLSTFRSRGSESKSR